MASKNPYPDLIRKLLQSKIVMSIKQIRHELADRPRSSLFRDLKKIELLQTSTICPKTSAFFGHIRLVFTWFVSILEA